MASLSYAKTGKVIELLKEVGRGAESYVRILDTNRLAVGPDPLRPTHIVYVSEETTGPYVGALPNNSSSVSALNAPLESLPPDFKNSRRGGEYWVEIAGERVACRSHKELLFHGLTKLEKTRPGTLDKLSLIKPRSKRIVAKNPKDLFREERLVKQYAEPLVDGWWYGTNNSAAETNTWLERACSCARLRLGQDFKTNMTITLEDL